jgi:molecular chaperone DnaK (HSP70)
VGIDFGTSATVVKVKNYGDGTNLRDYHSLLFNNSKFLPTLVFEDENKRLHFGDYAGREHTSGTEGVLYENFKLDLINGSKKAKSLVKVFFRYIYKIFSEKRGLLNVCPTVKTYVSYPAKWPPEIQSFMKQCAVDAGFGTPDTVFGIDEPTAAIYALLAENLENLQKEHIIAHDKPVNVFMLDMGTVTSNIVIFKLQIGNDNKPVIEIIATYPMLDNDNLCGGKEIDALLTEDVLKYLEKISKGQPIHPRILKNINEGAKVWKENIVYPKLLENKAASLPSLIDDIVNDKQADGVFDNLPFDDIDRKRFELITGDYWKRLRSLIVDSFEEAKKKAGSLNGAEDIDLVILTGEYSEQYGIGEFIKGEFTTLEPVNFLKIKNKPQLLLQCISPRETIARGLVYKDIEFSLKPVIPVIPVIRNSLQHQEGKSMKEHTIVGIDFGTSTTVVKVKNYGKEMNLRDFHSLQFNNSNCLPTLVFEDENGRLHFGYDAWTEISSGTKGVPYENFKMDLIDDSDKAKYLIKEFFKYIYKNFNEKRGELNVRPDVDTYVSYPAKWLPEIKSFMKQCAIDAGFGTEDKVFGLDEPTAAIYASLAENLEDLQKEHIIVRDKPVNVMMLDMGAGTSDIVIFKLRIGSDNKPVMDIITTYPMIDNDYLCGGREVDKLLAEDLINYLKKISKENSIHPRIIKNINTHVKAWKEDQVSKKLTADKVAALPGMLEDIVVPKQDDGSYENIPFDEINRKRFELITMEHWKQLRSLIADSINEAKKRAEEKALDFKGAGDIDLVILTGGHSKWYCIREFIKGGEFADLKPINFQKIKNQPQRLLQGGSPQETVAQGLVYKDIGFELKQVMGNSLWLQYEFCDQKSEIIPIATHNDVLPISNLENDFTFKVTRSICDIEELPFICHSFNGTTIESSKHRKKQCSVRLNGYIIAALIWVFKLFLGGDDQEYEVKVSTVTDISEDGKIKIRGTVYNENAPFEIIY